MRLVGAGIMRVPVADRERNNYTCARSSLPIDLRY
jgi:hypothetical protein